MRKVYSDLCAIERNDTLEECFQPIVRIVDLDSQILFDLGIRCVRLLSNTPMHIPELEGFGPEIVEIPIPVATQIPVCVEDAK